MITLHFLRRHTSQTPQIHPCPADTDPSAAVRGDGLPGADPPGPERMALLPERMALLPERMALLPDGGLADLFGRALLVRQWGRLGTEGHRRLDPHPDPGAAANALSDILRAKRRRGYRDRGA
jgi:hypothetical protein